MRNILFLCSIVLLLSHHAYARPRTGGDNDSTRHKNIGQPLETKTLRSFPQLDKYLQQNGIHDQMLNAPYSAVAEFTNDYITANYPITGIIADNRSQATQTFAEIDRQGRYIDNLTPSDLVELPVGMKKRLGTSSVTIGISKAKFTSTYSELTIFCKIDLPQGKTIFFGADKVLLSHNGGIIGNARLVLLGNFQIPINGGNNMLILNGGFDMTTGNIAADATGITVTCDGVKDLKINADVVFPRSLIEPLDANFNIISNKTEKVKGHLFIETSNNNKPLDFNNILASISIPNKFVIHGLSKVAFEVNNAYFDFSDVSNPEKIAETGYKNLEMGNLWRGVFISTIKVYLPKEFKKKNTSATNIENGRVTITGQNIIIDNWGFTGLVSAKDVFEDGNASGWEFSVDKFEIKVEANSLRGASFEGSIAIPLTQKPRPTTPLKDYGLAYSAIFTADNGYRMNVGLKQDLKFDVWKAQVRLTEGSMVELIAENDVFRPKAVLNGSMNILVVENGITAADLNGITFVGLTLQTVSPYLYIANNVKFSYTQNPRKVGNFPIALEDLDLILSNNNEVALKATFNLHLMDKDKYDFDFSASASLRVIGTITNNSDGVSYQYNNTILDAAKVKGDFGGFKLDGSIAFNPNRSGFKGNLEMDIKLKESTAKIEVAADFGTETTAPTPFRYWSVDAAVSGLKIPMGTGLDIIGFGGGASYKMKRRKGVSPVGLATVNFEPSVETGLGLRAMVLFAVKGDAGHGKACLEITFKAKDSNGTGGGLSRIGLFGEAEFMPPKALESLDVENDLRTRLANFTEKISDPIALGTFSSQIENGRFTDAADPLPDRRTQKSSIMARLGLEYDFSTKTLTGNLEAQIYANQGTVTGDGKMRLKFAPNEWYVYIGEPDPSKRVKIQVKIGSVNEPTAGTEINAYFVIGSTIPASPPPPAQVVNILGNKVNALNYMRDLNALKDGGGFAFGASLAASTGDLNFLIFYAKFDAGVGFDIMVKRYPPNTIYNCSSDNSTGNLGMNGWYANGQAYAYMQGELGVRARGIRIPIIKGAAAILLQAKLPNPSWFEGYMAGNYSVLGGLVKGSFNMKITLGKSCTLSTPDIAPELTFIQEISPADKATDVDIMAVPQVAFRQPLNTQFYLPGLSYDPSNDSGIDTFKAVPTIFKIYKLINPTTEQELDGASNYILNTNQDAYTYNGSNLLEPNTTYKIKVSVQLQKLATIDGIEQWTSLNNEFKETIFTTGAASQGIPLSNIEYSYPVDGQKYFHPGEHPKGYIKLRRGLPQISNNPSKKLVVLISSNQYYRSWRDATFNDNTIEFDLPSDDFINDQMTLTVFQIDNNTNCLGLRANTTGVQSTDLPPVHFLLNGLECGDAILTYKFSTSKYKTFREKMAAKFNNPIHLVEYAYANVPLLGVKGIPDEPFELNELQGTAGSNNKPLIQAEATLNNAYYTNTINDMLYSWTHNPNYPADQSFKYRNEKITGFEPKLTVEVSPAYLSALTNGSNNVESSSDVKPVGNSTDILAANLPFRYAAAKYYKEDFDEAKTYVSYKYPCSNANIENRVPGCIPSYLQPVNNVQSIPEMPQGYYSINFKYILPNGTITTVYPFTFNYARSVSGSVRER